ncbi:MAG: AraC family transcriptional regulator [Sciscionella sp.]|nr:AraC family transcriptional regulator [Sciscionella sp.]
MARDEFVVSQPTAALRSYVRRYIGYRHHGVALKVHRGLPSRSVTVVISLADPIRLLGDAEHGPRASQASASGLHLAPALIAQDAYQYGLHLELNPLGVRALLGMSATELADDMCELTDLPVPWARTLLPRLYEASDWEARFSLLDNTFLGALRPVTLVSEVQWAWRAMIARDGNLPVHRLADEVGWSRRHFTKRFASQIGVTPKQAARLIRFERSNALLRNGFASSLAELAHVCGYYDQAHMTNEWRVLAGCTPGAWIAEELPFLQYDSSGQRAESLS